MTENLNFAELEGRSVVVTGSSSGIGRAIALELARAGCDLIIHYRRSAREAELVQRDIWELGHKAEIVQADFSSSEAVERFVENCFDVYPHLDLWVNNAGVDLLTGDQAELSYFEKLRLLLDVDVRSTVAMTRLVGERIQASGRGAIVNIGWDQADRGMEGASGELFSTAKNAIMGYSRSAAMSLAPEVRVNCVCPGWIQTAWGETASDYWQARVLAETPLKRWGTPEDIAKAVRFLLSDDAAFITGQIINVNGGAVR